MAPNLDAAAAALGGQPIDAPRGVPYTLLRPQADVVAALLRHLLDDVRFDRNWTIESAVAAALNLEREPNHDQYDEGCDVLAAIAVRLETRSNGRYRLSEDGARLLLEVLNELRISCHDHDFRVA